MIHIDTSTVLVTPSSYSCKEQGIQDQKFMVKIQANLICHLYILLLFLNIPNNMYTSLSNYYFFQREKKKKTSTSVFYIHLHMLLASKYYDMKERKKKNDKVFLLPL